MITPEQLAASGTEHGHQCAVFCWANLSLAQYPQLKWMHSSANGIFTTSGHKAKEKAAGLKNGVWDIFLPCIIYRPNRIIWCGLYLEMKVKNNQLTKEQAEFRNDLANYYDFAVCWNWMEARDAIINYLEG